MAHSWLASNIRHWCVWAVAMTTKGLLGRAPKKEETPFFDKDHTRALDLRLEKKKYREEGLKDDLSSERAMMAEGLTKVQMSQIPLLHGTNVCFFGKHFLDICDLIRLAVNSAVLAMLAMLNFQGFALIWGGQSWGKNSSSFFSFI